MEQLTPYLGFLVVGVISLVVFVWADQVLETLARIEKQLKRLGKRRKEEDE